MTSEQINRIIILTVGILALSFATTGCKKEPYVFQSSLKVEKAFIIKTDTPEKITLNQGDYPATLNINSTRAKITVQTASGKNTSFRLRLPEKIKLPSNGRLTLSAEQTGQPFETVVDIKTDVSQSGTKREFENCTVQETDSVCGVVGNPPQTICQPITRTRWGQRQVEYFEKSYHRQIIATLSAEGQNSAQLTGSRVDREIIYLYQGMCF